MKKCLHLHLRNTKKTFTGTIQASWSLEHRQYNISVFCGKARIIPEKNKYFTLPNTGIPLKRMILKLSGVQQESGRKLSRNSFEFSGTPSYSANSTLR